MDKKERLVAAIENGTVIDHIPTDRTFQVISLLGLDKEKNPVTIGYNLPSERLGEKGIIKVSNRFFTKEEINKLSVVAPKIIMSIIKNFEVVDKITVETPKELKGIVKCNNPKCITNNEPMLTLFHQSAKNPSMLRCHYCEKEQNINEVEIC